MRDGQSKSKSAEVSQLLANVYRCVDKRSWYGSVAKAYARTRPRYPQELLTQMQNVVKLAPKQLVLEVGAGPGIASPALGQYGVELWSLEPNPTACQLGKSICAELDNIIFINQTFEDWQAPDLKFTAVVATTSFHWLDPQLRIQKTAAILEQQGWLVLLWNTPPQPNREIRQYLAPVYQKYAPELTADEEHQEHETNLTKIATSVIDSGYFTNLNTWRQIVSLTYSVDDYLLLLTTLSPYIALEASQRQELISQLRQSLILAYGNILPLSYLSCCHIMQKA